MIDKEHFWEISRKYGDCASWALWADEGIKPKSNIGDLNVFDIGSNPDILTQLNQNIIMVGLNISRRIEYKFGNFHDRRPQSQDYKIRYAFKNTEYYGAYMTDVIKDFEQVISGDVVSYLKKNKTFEEQNISLFKQELVDLKSSNPLIISFGNDAFNILDKYFRHSFRIIKIPHYSNHISKEDYKKEVHRILESIN